jgi:FkbM family methyltransferase
VSSRHATREPPARDRAAAPGRRSRWRYYLRSLPVVLGGFANPLPVLWRLAVDRRRPGLVRLRDGMVLEVRDALELWVVKEVCLDREYERGFTSLPSTATVLDIGAGVGELAVHLARRLPRSRVIAVEPAPDSHRLLQRNVQRNGVTNVVAVRAAVGPDDRPLAVDLGAPPAQRSARPATGPPFVAVPSTTLAALFSGHRIACCDLLKIDCEGSEEAILSGAPAGVLARVERLVVETHGTAALSTIAALLEDRGFSVRVAPSPVHSNLALVYGERSPALPPR